MQTRTMFLAAAASAVVLATAGIGLAQTAVDDTPSSAPTATATPGGDAQAEGQGGRRLVSAGSAGSVEYRFTDVLTIASVDPAPGWTAEIEQPRGTEIEVVFTNGARRIDVEVEVEHGAPRERIRERTDADRSPGTDEGVRADNGVGHDLDDDHRGDRDGSDDDRSGRDHSEDD
jgi:hypothetical protein